MRTTAEGQEHHRQRTAILADIEDADRAAAGTVAGPVRADVPGNLARTTLLPSLLARHPGLDVHLSEGERFVDLIREGWTAWCARERPPTAT